MMKNPQLITEVRHPEFLEKLVENITEKDGMRFSEISSLSTNVSWMDLQGLGWLLCEDWS